VRFRRDDAVCLGCRALLATRDERDVRTRAQGGRPRPRCEGRARAPATRRGRGERRSGPPPRAPPPADDLAATRARGAPRLRLPRPSRPGRQSQRRRPRVGEHHRRERGNDQGPHLPRGTRGRRLQRDRGCLRRLQRPAEHEAEHRERHRCACRRGQHHSRRVRIGADAREGGHHQGHRVRHDHRRDACREEHRERQRHAAPSSTPVRRATPVITTMAVTPTSGRHMVAFAHRVVPRACHERGRSLDLGRSRELVVETELSRDAEGSGDGSSVTQRPMLNAAWMLGNAEGAPWLGTFGGIATDADSVAPARPTLMAVTGPPLSAPPTPGRSVAIQVAVTDLGGFEVASLVVDWAPSGSRGEARSAPSRVDHVLAYRGD